MQLVLFAQKEGNIWYFGENAGIDFNSGVPIALTNGKLNTWEGCASICDYKGALLFYTDGVTVYNRNHDTMQNGSDLMGNISSTQSAVIVKQPGANSIYYIFTVDYQGNINGLRYSLVDMNLNGGLGAVSSNKNILIVTPTCEKIAVVKHENNKDFWIVIHLYGADTFNSYLLTSVGLNTTPIVSSIGTVISGNPAYTIGYMKSSSNGKRLAVAISFLSNVELFDFDNTTGLLSNVITFSNFGNPGAYGIEFSPNSNLLYTSVGSNIYQFNLLAGTAPAIINSETIIGTYGRYRGALQLAPDGKIYHSSDNENYLGLIDNPDSLGISCSYIDNGVFLGRNRCKSGLPTFYNNIYDTFTSFTAKKLCSGDSTLFSYASGYSIDSVLWSFDDAISINNSSKDSMPTHVFSSAGNYNVRLIAYSEDTSYLVKLNITILPIPTINLGNDTTLCYGDTLKLDLASPNSSYFWQDSSINSIFNITQTGKYWAKVALNGCVAADTIVVQYNPFPILDFGKDTTLCLGDTLALNASTPAGTYLWQDSSTSASFNINQQGIYWVKVTENNCSASDTINVNYTPLPTVYLGSDTTLCVGETLILNAGSQNLTYLWFDSSTSASNTISQQGNYWVKVTLNNCSATDTINVNFNPLPIVNLGNDTNLCNGDTLILDVSTSNATYLWQNNSTDSIFKVSQEGNYWVKVTLDNCNASDSIKVKYLPLPTVNLGNDTLLCVEETLLFDVRIPYATYLWQDNSTYPAFTIAQEGTYWVTVVNSCGSVADTINVSTKICNCHVYTPNAFTPNADNRNDLFAPVSDCDFEAFNLMIYNLWGEKIFETNDFTQAWDGAFQNNVCPIGVYAYLLSYKQKGKLINTHGNVTLLK